MDDHLAYYERLILKEFEGELSSNEKMELDEWLDKEQNRTFYEGQKKLWGSITDLHKMKRIDKKKALRKVETQVFGKNIFRRIKKLERIAAILFIPLLLTALWLFYHSFSGQRPAGQLVFNTIGIPLGTRSSLTLPDGTAVWLNAGSTLKYPVVFGEKLREVELIGEAYFEVEENKDWPFVVNASDINIKVLGTSFNCCAYPGDRGIETALVEGKVEITSKELKQNILMKAGELTVFSKQEKTAERKHVDLDKYIAWKTGRLMFRDDPMNKVIEKLGRWYGVEFKVENKEILNYAYSAIFSNESLDQVLKLLALSAPIDFQFLPREQFEDKTYGPQIIKLVKKDQMKGS